MWQLFGTLRNGESLKRDFHPDRLTIGRAPTNSIQLEDETVSSLHAEIELVGTGKHVLRDLGSKNGTFVDGVAVCLRTAAVRRPGVCTAWPLSPAPRAA